MKQKEFYCARFYITYRCNSRCSYCNVWRNPIFKNIEELSKDDALLLIKQCYDVGVRYIDFTGGEPTLYPYLKEVLSYAKKLGIKTEVTSNCIASFSKEKLIEVATTADKFNTSLDTLDNKTYALVRGVDSCESVKSAINDIAKIRAPKIMTVITKENIKDLDTMIAYAKKNKALIYLSPMFPYIDKNGTYQISEYIDDIISHIFDAYTVVLLHFMKFFKESTPTQLPPCSANLHTLTIAPNGNIALPCYHAIHEQIPWNKDLSKALESEQFNQYMNTSGSLQACRGCCVIPYFGISFNYQLNKYFILQSFSEKLYHLKRDALNQIMSELSPDKEQLQLELKKLLGIVNDMTIESNIKAYRQPNAPLYEANIRDNKAYTKIYNKPLALSMYQQELQSKDCWQLHYVPHYYFDKICQEVFIPLSKKMTRNSVINTILQNAMLFEVYWWKYYIIKYFKLNSKYDNSDNKHWLKSYLSEILALKDENFTPLILSIMKFIDDGAMDIIE